MLKSPEQDKMINVVRMDSGPKAKKKDQKNKMAPELEFGVVTGDDLTMHSMHTQKIQSPDTSPGQGQQEKIVVQTAGTVGL